ncbi:hypothetical protein SeLEV6574_g05717 [Synchytrium endobioticum]|uniref:Importin N-terminal domain-containing protein n=1 Tax=Synchytrium endobioticum TaxID=286115 RepID=A0A507CSQ8_9FUNG|nr:hypothetical protein SeLEV6574_g05717 [Synchytrium endobioticum]
MDIPSLVCEFFLSPNTSIERKQHIERTLTGWKSSPDAYRLALPFILSDGVDPHVSWFGLSVYESLMTKWSQIDASERRSIRSMFWDKLISQHRTMPPFLLNKMVKLVVDIAKQEFPHEYPDFFGSIYALKASSITLCLTLLKTIAEEFSQTGRQDVSAARKNELIQTLVILSSTITPSGSPLPESAFTDGMSMFSPRKLPGGNSFPSIGMSPSRPRNSLFSQDLFVHGGRITPRNATNSGLALEIIQTLLAIIPLEVSTSSYLMDTIDVLYKFAQLNDEATVALGTLAIACLNELMSRNYVPPGQFVDFILNISVHMGEVMRFLTDESPLSTLPRLSDIDEMYKSKCIEFIQHFMSQHFARAQGQFPVESFLELLYKFTFLQTSADGFQSCLRIWDDFLDFLSAQKENANTHSRYQESVYRLVQAVAKRCRHSENNTELEELSERTETDEHAPQTITALNVFRNHCADVIAKAAELYPTYVLQYLFSLLESDVDSLVSQTLHTDDLCTTIRDLTSLCIFFGRFGSLFTGSAEAASSATVIFDKILILLQAVQPIANASSVVGKAGIDLEKELFHMLILNIHWISLVNSLTRDHTKGASQFKSFVGRMVSMSLMSLSQQIPDVHFSGSSFMVSLTRTVRPNIMEEPDLVSFLRNVNSLGSSLRKDVLRNVYIFITNLFALPPTAKIDESEWASRADMFSRFCTGFMNPILTNGGQVTDRAQLMHVLNCLTAIFQAVKDEGTSSKLVVLQAVASFIPHLPNLLAAFANDMEVLPLLWETVLNLFLSLSRQLSRTDNAEGMTAILQAVLQQTATIAANTNVPPVVIGEMVTSLCNLFLVIVEDSTRMTTRFLPDIIASAVYTVYPKYLNSDIDALASARTTFFELVSQILWNHWKYFFGSQVNRLLGKAANNNANDDESKHRGEFNALIQVIAESFRHSDISVIKQNLRLLESLNEKCQLYTKIQDDFLIPFHLLFLSMLISRSHDFLREDIVTQVLAPMILVDLNKWKSESVPRFLGEYCTGRMRTEDERILASYLVNIRDQLSCVENLSYLVNDYSYFTSR